MAYGHIYVWGLKRTKSTCRDFATVMVRSTIIGFRLIELAQLATRYIYA